MILNTQTWSWREQPGCTTVSRMFFHIDGIQVVTHHIDGIPAMAGWRVMA